MRPLLLLLAARRKAGSLYAYTPDGDLPFNVVRNTTAYEVNSSGILTQVAANVPRFDWTNVTCPIILNELAATNLLLRSQEFDNAAWFKLNSTVSGNVTLAPDNTMTADKLVENTANAMHSVLPLAFPAVVSGSIYTLTVFAKAAERTRIYLRDNNRTFGGAYFNLSNGTIISTEANVITSSITPFTNGWYRCRVTYQTTTTSANAQVRLINTGTNDTYLGDGVSGAFIWQADLVLGSNASSPIITTAAATTRNADVITVTPPVGVTLITTTFEDGSTNEIVPSGTFTIPNGRIRSILMS